MKKDKKLTRKAKEINRKIIRHNAKVIDPFASGKFNSGDFIAGDREFGH
jgi:hypothetical protein